MRSRLLGLALAAVAAGTLAPTANAAIQYDTRCKGAVDVQCYHDFCGIASCVRSDCHVFVGVLGVGNTGICVGQARPEGEES